ncbi:MAG: HAMP domain-containing histidine kinase [Lachnospiraceae bacterium]|nr:HAMP domain-containing histidine kinase [Lachnospiraceae bacterium]
MMVLGLWAVLATTALLFVIKKQRDTYRKLDEILVKMMEGEQVAAMEFDESAFSLFSNHLKTLSDKLSLEIDRADQEKEQVKQLISNMSHQLKTPFANVMMYAELLEGDNLTEEQRGKFMGKLKMQLDKMDWLLTSLFKMTRLEQNVIDFEVEKAGIRQTIQNAIGMVYDKAEKKKISFQVCPFSDTLLWHNRAWTTEVIGNLLENAIKYTAEDGQIEISLESLENYSIIHIRDNGMGIDEEDCPHIFERFYRGKDAEHIEGSGIGLYLSKKILERERGYLTVKSDQGKGSDFAVFLQNC